MAVGIKVDFLWFSIGTGDFFHSFFSTVCVNLEKKEWGSRFPLIMNNLYSGKLIIEELPKAQKELIEIKKELSKLSPDKIIWDAEDLQKNPPWGDNISKDIQNLADYFVTNDGKNLIDVIDEAITEATNEKVNLDVKSL